jgi:hypothetical protein
MSVGCCGVTLCVWRVVDWFVGCVHTQHIANPIPPSSQKLFGLSELRIYRNHITGL